jgi:hypothetical protein
VWLVPVVLAAVNAEYVLKAMSAEHEDAVEAFDAEGARPALGRALALGA